LFPIHDINRPSIRPIINYTLILLNILVFFNFFLNGANALNQGIIALGVIPSNILKGKKLWTLFTSIFMHADIMHIFGNMLYLWVFGDNIEDALGHGGYLAFYLLGGLVASFTHIASQLIAPPSLTYSGLDIPSVGASGAVSAVLGAYILLYPRAKIRTLIFQFYIRIISIPAIFYIGFWFLYQLILGFISLTGVSSGIAFWAHIGGFVVGVVTVKGFIKNPTRSRVRRRPTIPVTINSRYKTPIVDVILERDTIQVISEIPGVDEEKIRIRATENEVTISVEDGEARYYKRVLLPTRVQPRIMNYSYRNGVLNFSLPRRD
jgi:membrane associated rhomboid family serine protease